MDLIENKYHSGVYDLVQKLPGITSKNIDTFLRKMVSLDQALKSTEDELKEVLGNSTDAQALYSMLHVEQKPTEDVDSVKQKGKAKARRKPYNT